MTRLDNGPKVDIEQSFTFDTALHSSSPPARVIAQLQARNQRIAVESELPFTSELYLKPEKPTLLRLGRTNTPNQCPSSFQVFDTYT